MRWLCASNRAFLCFLCGISGLWRDYYSDRRGKIYRGYNCEKVEGDVTFDEGKVFGCALALLMLSIACKAQKNVVGQKAVADNIVAGVMEDLWEQTDEHFHQGEYNHVVNLSRVIVQAEPKRVEAYANSAWLLWSTDRNADAIAFLKQGLNANLNTYYMYDELGAHYFSRLHDPKTAIPYYEKAVTFACPYSTLHALANCYEKTDEWAKSVATWKRATKFKDDRLAPVRLKRAEAELARRQHS